MKYTTDINYKVISESYLKKYLHFFCLNERRGIRNNIIILLIFSLIAVPYGILSLIDGNVVYVIGGSVAVIAVSLWWISYIINSSFQKI